MSILGNKVKTNKISGEAPPPDENNLIAWWDASDESTITLNGNNITAWIDKSGNSKNLENASGPGTITIGNQLNGRNTIEFNRKQIRTTPLISINEYTIFIIAKTNNLSSDENGCYASQYLGANAGRTIFLGDNIDAGGHNVASKYATVAETPNTNWHKFIYTKSTTILKYERDGIEGIDNLGSTAPGDSFVVGGYDQSFPKYCKANIAEILVYNTAINTTNQKAYLLAKWGI